MSEHEEKKKKNIICPKCGKVERYYITEQVRRGLVFDADGEPHGATEDIVFYTGKVERCLRCNSKVKITDKSTETYRVMENGIKFRWNDLTEDEKDAMRRQYISVRAVEDEITEEEAEERYYTGDEEMKRHRYIRENGELWIDI